MKKLLYFLLTVPTLYWSQTQRLGINTEEPQALLDVTHIGAPTSQTGLLIPTINNFPTANPTAEQNGLLVYYKGTEMNHGFYYWDNVDEEWQYIFQSNTVNNNLAAVAYVATTPFATIPGNSTAWYKTSFNKINTPNTKFKISTSGDIVVGEAGTYNLNFTGGVKQMSPNNSALSYEITIIKKAATTGTETTLQTARLALPAADVADRSTNTTLSLNHTFAKDDVIIVRTKRVSTTTTATEPATKYSLILSKLSV